MTIKTLTNEVRRECKMRLRVWRTADKQKARFINSKHQKQYDELVEVGCILSVMTDKEYQDLKKRYEESQRQRQIELNL